MQAYNSIIYRYLSIGFIDFMLKDLLDYTNLFSPNEYGNNEKITQMFSIIKDEKIILHYTW